MAGKPELTMAALEAAVKAYCDATKGAAYQAVSDGPNKDQFKILVNGDPERFVWLEEGKLRASDPEFGMDFNRDYILASHVPPTRAPSIPKEPRSANGGALVRSDMPVRDIQVSEMSFDDIRQYICPAASDKDVFMFLKLCQARNLNPFIREAFLIPYKDNKSGEIKCSMVVGKEAFMRKAEVNSQYRGFKAGIIVSKDDALIYREGTFQRPGETLEGGWAEVYRDDRQEPVRSEVSLTEYDSGKGLWGSGKKATMIRKVAVVQAHREAFPSDLAGCYDSSELGIDESKEIRA